MINNIKKLAERYYIRGDYEYCEDLLNIVLKDDATDIQARLLISKTYLNIGRLDLANENLKTIIGYASLDGNNCQEAEEILEQVETAKVEHIELARVGTQNAVPELAPKFGAIYEQLKFEADKVSPEELDALLSRTVPPESIKKAVSICSHGRSGSYLFGSIFDGHPNVIHVLGSWINGVYAGFTSISPMDYEQVVASAVHLIFDPNSNYYAYTSDEELNIVDGDRKNRFLAVYFALAERYRGTDNLRGMLIRNVFIAYHAVFGLPQPKIPSVIVYHMHVLNERFARNLAEDFEEVDLLTVLRTPSQTVASHLRHHIAEKKTTPYSQTPLAIYQLHLTGDDELDLGDHVRNGAVRFEDMHTRTRYVAEQISSYVGIDFDEVMLESTENGKPYGQPRTVDGSKQFISGFGHNVVLKKQTKWFSYIDGLRLEAAAYETMQLRGYATRRWLKFLPLRFCALQLSFLYPFACEISAWKIAHEKEPGNAENSLNQFFQYGIQLRRAIWDGYKANRQGRQKTKLLYAL